MTKKVTQNVTNSNSEDFTELYQKGKLPKGYYYLKKPDGEVMIITPSLRFMVDGYSILAEVPSYEQWKMVYKTEFELLEQVVNLKELLKRVNEHFKWVDCDDNFYVNEELWDDIKKVLGEE